MNVRELAIKNCEGINGFTESEFSNDSDITFKQGEQVRQINIDLNKYNTIISLTHWCRPGQFHAADRVRIHIEPKYMELYPAVIKDIAKNFDKIISDFRFHKEKERNYWMSGDVAVKSYLNIP